MGVHSKFLIHWTGAKDIEKRREPERSQQYVERLRDDLENGLFTKRTTEDAIREKTMKHIIRICFTEIRLSQAQTHAERYGKLGIGFARDFVTNKGGSPVIYIPFKPKADRCLLEAGIANAYDESQGHKKIERSLKWIMAHVKRMSNGNGEDYYEEMEWRIVYDESPDNKHFKREGNGVHRLKFAASDIKVIIFPNEQTKRRSLEDEAIREHLSGHMPMMATLDDCGNF